MDSLFTTDINNILIEYMSTKEMFDMKKSIDNMKLTDAMIKKKFIQNINSRLADVFGDKLDTFKKFLEDTQSFISGSFIMQCILEEKYDGSDIDIYTCKKENVVNYPLELGTLFPNEKENMPNNNDARANIHYYQNSGYEVIATTHYDVCDFYMNEFRIQFIITEKPYSMIDNFDMDICKNTYSIKNGKEYVSVHNIDQLLEKKSDYIYRVIINDNSNNVMNRYMTRYYKYIDRKYIINKIIPKNVIDKYTNNTNIYISSIISEDDHAIKIICKRKKNLPTRHGIIVFNMEDKHVYNVKKHTCGKNLRYYRDSYKCKCKCKCYYAKGECHHSDNRICDCGCRYSTYWGVKICEHIIGKCDCKCDCKCELHIFNCNEPRKCVFDFLSIRHIHCDYGSTVVLI